MNTSGRAKKDSDLLFTPPRIHMLSFERRQGPVQDDGSHAGVGDVLLVAFTDTVLPGLAGERKGDEKEQWKDCSEHRKPLENKLTRPLCDERVEILFGG